MNTKSSHLLLLFATIILIILSPMTVNATNTAEQDQQNVKVGVFDMPGFWNISNEQTIGGYAYDYLNALQNYSNINYTYEYHSLAECLSLLQDGKLDIVPGIQATTDRKEKYSFPLQSMGTESGIIITNTENTTLVRNEYTSINGLKIGCLLGNIYGLVYFNDFESLYQLDNTIVYYSTNEEMEAALDNQDVDALLVTSLTNYDNYKSIVTIHDAPIYIATNKNDTSLISILDNAQANLILDDPYFQYNLARKYSSSFSHFLDFTTEEKNYINETKDRIINVGITIDAAPYSYLDETGQYRGIIPAVMDKITDYTGFQFHYVAIKNMTDGLHKLAEHSIDILPQYWKADTLSSSIDASITTPYIPVTMVALYTDDSNYEGADSITLGVDRDISRIKDYLGYDDHIEYSVYQNFNDCIEALDQGAINGVLTSYDKAQTFLFENKVSDYQFSVFEIAKYNDTMQSMVISNTEGTYLFSIINKCLRQMNEDTLSEIIDTETILTGQTFSLSMWAKDNFLIILIGFLGLIAILIAIIVTTNLNRLKFLRIVNTDTVTSCMSYTHFLKVATKAISSNDEPYALLKTNIIHFRFINETYGQTIGDDVLSCIVKASDNYLGDNGYITRQEADHFILLIKCSANYQEGFKRFIHDCNKLVQEKYNLKLRFNAGSYILKPGDSIISAVEKTSHILADFSDADVNILRPFDSGREKIINAIKLIESDSDSALKNHQFVAYYQPKYNYKTDQIIGAEALVRWLHPTNGSIPLNEFLPYFEQSGAIITLDFYIFEEACKFIRGYNMKTGTWITLSSNFSTKHLNYSDFAPKLYNITKKYSIPTKCLEIEITETVAMIESEILSAQMKILHKLGFKLSLDDFGSGYSSLGILETCDFDIIKLDRSFMLSTMAAKNVNILKGIINLITQSGMETICEGVETQEQISILRTTTCDTIQGFYFSRPIPEAEFYDLLEKYSTL